jgi:FlaA1/EpsC-like NDP-sugar epimerase
MRMIDVNIFNTVKTVEQSIEMKSAKYFCVSTDKAANPVNMMGASKRIMEMFLMDLSSRINVSTARFANVAFSDGSLLHGFNQRVAKQQPIAAPDDVRRYFVTPKESGELCLMSCLMGDNRDIFFPKLNENLHLIKFSEIAVKYLHALGYEPVLCSTEDEARARVGELVPKKKWPCYFFTSDTTGEKDFEEFYTDKETIDWDRFSNIGVIKNSLVLEKDKLEHFTRTINECKKSLSWNKDILVDLFKFMIPDFGHKETNKYLDQRM